MGVRVCKLYFPAIIQTFRNMVTNLLLGYIIWMFLREANMVIQRVLNSAPNSVGELES